MADDFGTPITPLEEPKKKNNTLLIIIIVVVVLLCICCAIVAAGWYLYTYGDQIFNINTSSQLLGNLLI
jgi:flagellar basal body-associated protein FliL